MSLDLCSETILNPDEATSTSWANSDQCHLPTPDAYFGLLDELRTIFGAEVDLVMAGALNNRYIGDDVNRTKRNLYEARTSCLSRRHSGIM
jgi:hypothetical protein